MPEVAIPSRRCKVLIVENNEDLARSVAGLLGLEPDLEPVGCVALAADALPRARALAADVMLLDMSLRDGSGFTVLEQAAREAPGLKIIIYTGYASPVLAAEAVARGASACVVKGGDFETLCAEIRRALATAATA
jgi:DNA-binding NarL/FixJ family response regulator